MLFICWTNENCIQPYSGAIYISVKLRYRRHKYYRQQLDEFSGKSSSDVGCKEVWKIKCNIHLRSTPSTKLFVKFHASSFIHTKCVSVVNRCYFKVLLQNVFVIIKSLKLLNSLLIHIHSLILVDFTLHKSSCIGWPLKKLKGLKKSWLVHFQSFFFCRLQKKIPKKIHRLYSQIK